METRSLIDKLQKKMLFPGVEHPLDMYENGMNRARQEDIDIIRQHESSMGEVNGVGLSSDLKPETMGSPVTVKGDNLASPATHTLIDYLKARCQEMEWSVNSDDVIDFAEDWVKLQQREISVSKCADCGADMIEVCSGVGEYSAW